MTGEELVELMAEPAHNAWMQWYADRGYTSRRAEWGEEFMVPFERLSEKGKELDRVIMRSILNSFREQGLEVRPKPVNGPLTIHIEPASRFCPTCGYPIGT